MTPRVATRVALAPTLRSSEALTSKPTPKSRNMTPRSESAFKVSLGVIQPRRARTNQHASENFSGDPWLTKPLRNFGQKFGRAENDQHRERKSQHFVHVNYRNAAPSYTSCAGSPPPLPWNGNGLPKFVRNTEVARKAFSICRIGLDFSFTHCSWAAQICADFTGSTDSYSDLRAGEDQVSREWLIAGAGLGTLGQDRIRSHARRSRDRRDNIFRISRNPVLVQV